MKRIVAPIRRAWKALGLMGLASLAPVAAAQSPPPCDTGFLNGRVDGGGKTMRYVVYVPHDYTPERQWPVILFLHGAYADGQDGFAPVFTTLPPKGPYVPENLLESTRSVAGSLGVAVMRKPQQFPCLVLFPQAPSQQPSLDVSGWSGINGDLALRALEAVIEKYHGDRNRVYLTGLSLGGEGTWKLASDRPELFAAAIPIAASEFLGLPPVKVASALKSMPIWVLHGGADGLIDPAKARDRVNALQAAGNAKIRYTEYPGVDHNCWDLAYNDPRVIEWLLAQKR
jgi:predicted peptidase